MGIPRSSYSARGWSAPRPESSPSANRRARDALPVGGTVLDVGVGAGAASLPLSPRCSLIIGVDSSADLLSEFRRQARRVGVAVSSTVKGEWPARARRTPIGRRRRLQPRRLQRRPTSRRSRSRCRRTRATASSWRSRAVTRRRGWPTSGCGFTGSIVQCRPDADDARLAAPRTRPRRSAATRGAAAPAPVVSRGARMPWRAIRRRLCLDASRDAEVATRSATGSRHDDGFWSVRRRSNRGDALVGRGRECAE